MSLDLLTRRQRETYDASGEILTCMVVETLCSDLANAKAENETWRITCDAHCTVLQGVVDILGDGHGDPELLAKAAKDENEKLRARLAVVESRGSDGP